MVYKWYFSCQLGDGLCHRSHRLGEPETTIEHLDWLRCPKVQWSFSCSLCQVHGKVWSCCHPRLLKNRCFQLQCSLVVQIAKTKDTLFPWQNISEVVMVEAIVTSGPGLTNMVTPMQASLELVAWDLPKKKTTSRHRHTY